MVSLGFGDSNNYTIRHRGQWHTAALILIPFLAVGERLRISLMFHCDQKWRAGSVKRTRLAESLAIFDHDNEAARYIWGKVYVQAGFIRPW